MSLQGLGTSERFFYENNSSLERKAGPGPGAYTLGPAHGRQVTSDRPSYRITSFSRADRDRTAATVYLGPKQQSAFWGRNSPGPAVYTLTQAVGPQNSSQRPNGPKYAGWVIRTMSDGMTALRQQDTRSPPSITRYLCSHSLHSGSISSSPHREHQCHCSAC